MAHFMFILVTISRLLIFPHLVTHASFSIPKNWHFLVQAINVSQMSPKLLPTWLGDYNGTIFFFEIDIMKNSSPINLNLRQTWLLHKCFGRFFCFDLLLLRLWSWAESAVSPAEKKCYFGFDMAKNVNFKLSGDEFFMMSISKMMVPL